MKNSYIVTEEGSNIVIAVVTGASNTEIRTKTATAVEEHFIYDSVKPTGKIVDRGNVMFMSFHCEVDDGSTEIRDIELSLTAIY